MDDGAAHADVDAVVWTDRVVDNALDFDGVPIPPKITPESRVRPECKERMPTCNPADALSLPGILQPKHQTSHSLCPSTRSAISRTLGVEPRGLLNTPSLHATWIREG